MSKGHDTRATILGEALATASRLGLDGLSIGKLAKQVGLSKSGLFAHFESKEDLQLQILDTAADLFIERVISPALRRPRGLPRVRALYENWLQWEDSSLLPGGCLFISVAQELDDRPGRLRDRLVAYQQDLIGFLAQAAAIAKAEGHFHADVNVEQFAYDVYSVILAYHHFSRLLRDPKAAERARSAFESLLASCQTTN